MCLVKSCARLGADSEAGNTRPLKNWFPRVITALTPIELFDDGWKDSFTLNLIRAVQSLRNWPNRRL